MTKSEGSISVRAMSRAVSRNNLLFGVAVFFICIYFFGRPMATGFGLGLLVGIINYQILFRSALKGSQMEPEVGRSFIVKRFYTRFMLIAAAYVVIIFYLKVDPIGVMGGYTLTLFVATGTIFKLSNREVEPVVDGAPIVNKMGETL